MANQSQAPRVAEPEEWPESDSPDGVLDGPSSKVARRRPKPPRRPSGPHAPRTAERRPRPSGEAGSREGRRGASQQDSVDVGPLPTLGVFLARPLLLAGAVIVGALIGMALTATGAYKAEAVLEFSAPGSDSGLVRQMGQTLARTALASDVEQSAETASGTGNSKLGDRTTAKWVTDTQLVAVAVTAATPDAAVLDANAVAQAVLTARANNTRKQQSDALNEFNAALKDQALENPQAEAARRAQLGTSLAVRQDAITAQSGQVTVLDAASVAGPAGLTRPMGLMIGAALGFMLAVLISVLLGVRGLRVRSTWTLRYLLSEWRTASPGQAAEIAGRLIESRKNGVAFIATEGTDEATRSFASEIKDCLEAHGRTVRTVDLIGNHRSSTLLRLLRHDVRDDVDGEFGSDLVLYTVRADSKAAALLQGQSNLRAFVVAQRRRTRVEHALRAMKSFSPARPVLILMR